MLPPILPSDEKIVDDNDLDHDGIPQVAGEDALGTQGEIAVTQVAARPAVL